MRTLTRLWPLGLLVLAAGCQGTPEVVTPISAVPVVTLAPPPPAPVEAPPPPVPQVQEPAPAAGEERVARLPTPAETEPPPAPPAAAPERGFIGRDRVNFRPCPEETPRCAPVGALRLNEEVEVLRQEGDWLLVRVARLDREGYVWRRFVAPRLQRPPTTRVATPGPPSALPKDGARPRPAGQSPQEELLQ